MSSNTAFYFPCRGRRRTLSKHSSRAGWQRPKLCIILSILAAVRLGGGWGEMAELSFKQSPGQPLLSLRQDLLFSEPSPRDFGAQQTCAAAHTYRASVRHRWHGVKIAGLFQEDGTNMGESTRKSGLRSRTRSPRFETPAACLAAAAKGYSLMLDAEEMVERQLRKSPADDSMFLFLSKVALALARYSATHGIRLVSTPDCERVLGWMKAEGLTPCDAQYRTLLSVMIADTRWEGLCAAWSNRCQPRPGSKEGRNVHSTDVEGCHEGGSTIQEGRPQDSRRQAQKAQDESHAHIAGRECSSFWWRRLFRRY